MEDTMITREQIEEAVCSAFTQASGIEVAEPGKCLLDDHTVNTEVAEIVNQKLGIHLWPIEGESVGDYIGRIAIKLDVDAENDNHS